MSHMIQLCILYLWENPSAFASFRISEHLLFQSGVYKVLQDLIFFPIPIFFKILIFYPKFSVSLPPFDILLKSLNIIGKMTLLPLSLFSRYIIPQSLDILFPSSQLDILPNRLDKLPPSGGIKNFIHPCNALTANLLICHMWEGLKHNFCNTFPYPDQRRQEGGQLSCCWTGSACKQRRKSLLKFYLSIYFFSFIAFSFFLI